MRCNGQYNSSMVTMELDGSLNDPSYVTNLPNEERESNQNVFPFSLSVAGMKINLMLRYLLALGTSAGLASSLPPKRAWSIKSVTPTVLSAGAVRWATWKILLIW